MIILYEMIKYKTKTYRLSYQETVEVLNFILWLTNNTVDLIKVQAHSM